MGEEKMNSLQRDFLNLQKQARVIAIHTYIYAYIYIYIYIYIFTHNKSVVCVYFLFFIFYFLFFFIILIGWQLNGFHSCLIGEKESHRLERSLNYYQIGFDGIVNGKLKSQEMIIKRERERIENGNRFSLMEHQVIDGKLKNGIKKSMY